MIRGVRFHKFGGPEVLQIENVIVPEPGPDEVRLRIKAIGLNRGEILMRSGRAATKANLPAQLGVEAAGVVELLGSNVKDLVIGDRVAVVPRDLVPGYYPAAPPPPPPPSV